MCWNGKVALVTGSTSGIGHGIACARAEAGADLTTNDFGDLAQIEALRGAVAAKHGARVGYSAADILKPLPVAAMVEETTGKLGSVDILVNNGGIRFIANVEDFPTER